MGKTNTSYVVPFLPYTSYGFDFLETEFALSFVSNELSLFRFRRAFPSILYL